MRKFVNRRPRAVFLPLALLAGLAGLFLAPDRAEAACTFSLMPTNRTHGYTGSTGLVSVTTSSNVCAWNVINTNGWITIDSGATGTGDGTVGYTVAANPSLNPRSGVLVIGGQPFTVNEGGIPCNFSIVPATRNHGYGATNNTVALTASSNLCAWTITPSNNWITITSTNSGKGSATVAYKITANPNGLVRTGFVGIADQTLTLIQTSAPCTFSISPHGRTHGFVVDTGLVTVTSLLGCDWTTINTNNWITIDSGASGTGSATLGYTVALNPNAVKRIGVLTIAGNPYSVTQQANFCTYRLSPTNRPHGYGATTGSVTVIASSNSCPWSASTTNDWIQITSGFSGTGTVTGGVSYAVSANPSSLDRTGRIMVATQVLTLIQQGAPCTYSISPGSRNHGYGITTNSITLTTPDGCTWSVANTNNWITILSATNNTNGGAVIYMVTNNPVALTRTGLVAIADQVLTLSQNPAPCTFSLLPTNRVHSFGMETGQVSVTTPTGCPWTVSNTNTWITILSGTNGSNSGAVTYSVATNPSPRERTGVIAIESQFFTVTQQANPCSFKLSTTSRTHGYAATTGTFNVTNTTITCAWAAVNTNSWITITPPAMGIGNGTVNYSVDANPTPFDRVGAITVADQILTLTQRGFPCTFSLSPTNTARGRFATNGTIVLTANSNACPWSIVSTDSWVSITSPLTGTGSVNISYSIEANGTPFDRTALILIADQIFTLTQHGINCGYSLSPSARTHGHGATNGTVSLNTSSNICPWTVVNTNGWITITSTNNGVGDANVDYLVAANLSQSDRTGQVMIADQLLTLAQHGISCSYSISPTNRPHGYGASTNNTVAITTGSACNWDVVNTNTWITISAGTNGVGNGTITYTVDANPSSLPRNGTLVIVDEILTLSQAGAPCVLSLTPDTQVHGFGVETGLVSVAVPADCPWNVVNTNPWITITPGSAGNGSGSFGYSLAANLNPNSRTGMVSVAGQIFTVDQFGTNCAYIVSPPNRTHGYAATTGTVSVITGPNCAWAVANTNSWISILLPGSGGGTGTGSVTYAVAVNPGFNDRTGIVLIGDQALTLTQRGYLCTYSISPANRNHGYAGATNSVLLSASSNLCAWSVVNTNDWVAITSSTNGIGDMSVSYAVAFNASLSPRSGAVMIADQALTLTQAGFPCNFKLSPTNRVHGFGASTGSVTVSASTNLCAWNVVNTNSWITIQPQTTNSGNGILAYLINANFTTNSRTAVVMIGDQWFSLTQRGVTNGISFLPAILPSAGQLKLTLAGGPGGLWDLQASSDLTHWQKIATLTNITGRMDFTDTVSNTATQRFYRAVQPIVAATGPSLAPASLQTTGQFKLTLTGEAGGVWKLQASSDLVHWQNISSVTNDTGSVDFIDTPPTNSNSRFYRAVQP